MQAVLQDLRFAIRTLRKNPGLSVAVVATLALGFGLTAAIFSVVSAVLLRPLPYPKPAELVQVEKEWQPPWLTQPEATQMFGIPELVAWQKASDLPLRIAAYDSQEMSLGNRGGAKTVRCGRLSASLLPILGVAPALGRIFVDGEDQPGGAAVALLSHPAWQRRFGGDPQVVGKTIHLDQKPYMVVGVLPAAFRFVEDFDVCIPLRLKTGDPEQGGVPRVIGRLAPGHSPEQARAALDSVYQAVADPKEQGRILVADWHANIVRGVKRSLWVYQAAAAFVLLIACANVANLLLSHAARRRKEIAVRLALGAGRLRVVRQLLTESLLLAGLGAAFGLAVAFLAKGLVPLFITKLPKLPALRIDGAVLGFALVTALLTGLLFGLAPALHASRCSLHDALKASFRGSGAAQQRFSRLLVVAEVALAFVLLVGAGLLLSSFVQLHRVNLGYRLDRILSLTVELPKAKYPDPRSRALFFEQLIDQVRSLRDVEAVGANVALPLTPMSMGFMLTGASNLPPVYSNGGIVNADYFRAVGIPLKKGRCFIDSDREGSERVAVVSDSFVQRYFPNDEPVGKRVGETTIVGLVGDVRDQGPRGEIKPHIYFPYLQGGLEGDFNSMSLAVRSRNDPMKLVPAIRTALLTLDREQKFVIFMTLKERLAEQLSPERLSTTLASALAGLAIGLAVIGIYAVLSFSVTQRTHEIGVRMALGARPGHVLRLVVRDGMTLVIAGAFFGCFAAFCLTRFLENLLFQVSALDPVTIGATLLLLGAIALVACYLPARRAAMTDPMLSLRSE